MREYLRVWSKRSGSTLKAWRSKRSKGKSSRSQRLSASKGLPVAECHTQTHLTEFGGTADPAMENTAEQPSAANDALKASGSQGSTVQRTEAQSGTRSNASMILDKARDLTPGLHPVPAGDSYHGKGGTRKLKVSGGVHSTPVDTKDRSVHAAGASQPRLG